MARAIAIKVDEDLLREVHIRAAKKGLSIQEYIDGLIRKDLFPVQVQKRSTELNDDRLERIKSTIHAAEAGLHQIEEILDRGLEHNTGYADMSLDQ